MKLHEVYKTDAIRQNFQILQKSFLSLNSLDFQYIELKSISGFLEKKRQQIYCKNYQFIKR